MPHFFKGYLSPLVTTDKVRKKNRRYVCHDANCPAPLTVQMLLVHNNFLVLEINLSRGTCFHYTVSKCVFFTREQPGRCVFPTKNMETTILGPLYSAVFPPTDNELQFSALTLDHTPWLGKDPYCFII